VPSIHVTSDDRRVRLTAPAEVDVSNSDELQAAGLAAIESGEADAVIVDLGEVTFLDSSGMGALVLMNNAAQAAGRPLLLANVPSAVTRLFEITVLTGAFTYDS
jgi:anti-sigma B factor antagonist